MNMLSIQEQAEQREKMAAKIGAMSFVEICKLMHTYYHRINGINLSNKRGAESRAEHRKADTILRLAHSELNKRGLKSEPIYEVLWRVEESATGQIHEFWAPYRSSLPHPEYPSGAQSWQDKISNFNEIERQLEAIRPGLSRESRSKVQFVVTRRRAGFE